MTTLLWLLGWFFIAYSVAINASFIVLSLLAMGDFAAYRRKVRFAAYDESFAEPLARGVSVLMPAYDEELTIVASVQAMTSLRYPDFEVIVIDDGSRDSTVATMVEAFDMVELPLAQAPMVATKGEVLRCYVSTRGAMDLLLVCKANGGKADALNTGINVARKELVCMVDADSLLDPDALLHVSRPFADDPERVIASGGVVRVANGSTIAQGRVTDIRMPTRWLPRVQVVEYLRAFLIGRAGWSAAGGLLIISGAFGMFRRDILFEVGGVATDCIGEDAELVVRLYRWMGDNDVDGRIVFVSEPVAWTEAPETVDVLRKQRRRWHRGLAEIFARHRGMLLRPRYGFIGMITMPWFLLFELLAPFIEVFGLVYFAVVLVLLGLGETGLVPADWVSLPVVVVLLSTSIAFAIVMSLVALLVEEMSYRRYRGIPGLLVAVWSAVEENIGYRQLTAWWRMRGAIDAWRGSAHVWGDMKRQGFDRRT
ncbi:Glycosyltransferase, catalytic subunit of cellulose synthase and poly-beta-1,6-N-acetylglucosamine synthase [Nocardioides scoriae]|uniref:Glycosyltransferase, catalytic subunit of cellulose synthase and poly-beta-1,6-N-acetylglucosamine synthase n=1 Tax=Nocardioides scoriae TaxID=642780 RepID=A0A1H1XXW3_9ACTN|nr:glycosyltransferase [Nocardioides scoriae]SDT14117.1 Glycosyltransferase, catalytic subunit of cellulose synthase and poly-beta-1,6-N-acetylglucosamine synthase [Nocardioides scoriae]